MSAGGAGLPRSAALVGAVLKAVLLVDDAVGERRRLLVDAEGEAFRLEIHQTRALSPEPRVGEAWTGRLTARAADRKDWFVDLGTGPAGVLSGVSGERFHEGAWVAVRIRAEAWAEKGPLLELSSDAPRDKAGWLKAPDDDSFLDGVELQDERADHETRAEIDAVIRRSLDTRIPLIGGGDIHFDQTRALLAIDVDAGSATALGRKGHAARLNEAAAIAAARLIALRNAAGLVVVDFLPLHSVPDRKALTDLFRDRLTTYLGRKADVLGLSRLGLCEAAISRRTRPFARALALDKPEMRQSLDLLRNLESQGRSNRGSRLIARAPCNVLDWLLAKPFDWEADLANRIGRRWRLEQGNGPAQVWSET